MIHLYDTIQRYYDRTGAREDDDTPTFTPAAVYIGITDIIIAVHKPSYQTKVDYDNAPVIHVSELYNNKYQIRKPKHIFYRNGRLGFNPKFIFRNKPYFPEFHYRVDRAFGLSDNAEFSMWFYDFHAKILHGIREPTSGNLSG